MRELSGELLCYEVSRVCLVERMGYGVVDPFKKDVIRGTALKSVSFVLCEFSQIANTEPKLTTDWLKRGEQLRNE